MHPALTGGAPKGEEKGEKPANVSLGTFLRIRPPPPPDLAMVFGQLSLFLDGVAASSSIMDADRRVLLSSGTRIRYTHARTRAHKRLLLQSLAPDHIASEGGARQWRGKCEERELLVINVFFPLSNQEGY